MSIVSDFVDFISKADVTALAVAVVFGVAFNNIITAMVTDVITPLIGIPGSVNFNSITYTVHGSTFLIGPFINSIINFIIIALVVFFIIVRPLQKLEKVRQSKKAPASSTTKTCPHCLQTIPIKATRCMYCTSKVK